MSRNTCVNVTAVVCRPLARVVLLLVLSVWACASASAQCPSNQGKGWPRGTEVHFYIDPSITGTQRSQLLAAIGLWNEENKATGNNSLVKFVEDTTDSAAVRLHFIPNSTDPIVVTDDDGSQVNAAGIMRPDADPANPTTIKTATIQLDPNPRAGVDPTREGSDTIFLKLYLHEIGHTMGLNHPKKSEETAQRTVMNRGASRMGETNDSLNNIPTTIKDCDRNAIKSSPLYATEGGTDPGDGGGGDGGGGDTCHWVYECTQFCYTYEECTAYDDCGDCYWYTTYYTCDPPDCTSDCVY